MAMARPMPRLAPVTSTVRGSVIVILQMCRDMRFHLWRCRNFRRRHPTGRGAPVAPRARVEADASVRSPARAARLAYGLERRIKRPVSLVDLLVKRHLPRSRLDAPAGTDHGGYAVVDGGEMA